MSSISYPVRVDATLEPRLSRWLWLVKWLLVVPHYVVLFFLWVAFFVLSVCAFAAIVVTGHYPRGIFHFNVGVLRWSWRVAYYAYGGLATDKYPPFSLEEVPDYPAHLEIAYPERLSRGLALVKWWLLAIPHYLVLAVFLGGGWYATSHERTPALAGGLIGLLVLVAAVVLLFTGRYPQPLFDLVLGLNRWVLRVAAYVALMTDEYPPFRLDMGGSDPAGSDVALRQPPSPGATTLVEPAEARHPDVPQAPTELGERPTWGAGRVLAVVAGTLLFLIGGGLATAGGTIMVADATMRDAGGYLMSPTVSLSSAGHALVSENLQLRSDVSPTIPQRLLGRGKLQVDAAPGRDVFVAVTRSEDAARYLSGMSFSMVHGLRSSGGRPTYTQHAGGAPALAPTSAGIWVASAQGPGRQSVTWPLRTGSWVLVVMNVDGSRNVDAHAAVGATVPAAVPVAIGLLASGGLLLIGSIVVLLLAVRRGTR